MIHSVTPALFQNPPALLLPDGMSGFHPHHFQGSLYDNCVELAGRLCYASCKQSKSRNSVEYHKHINETNNSSVQAHAAIAVLFEVEPAYHGVVYKICANRPGVWIESSGNNVYIITNLRAIREWFKFSVKYVAAHESSIYHYIHWALVDAAKKAAPFVMSDIVLGPHCSATGIIHSKNYELSFGKLAEEPSYHSSWSKPTVNHHLAPYVHHSFIISGVSRNLTHELIRHSYRAAISQRSTRYVDESESEFVEHPLIKKFGNGLSGENFYLPNMSRDAYSDCFKHLYAKLIAGGTDSHAARKAARGAARGYLLSSLGTELMYTATAAQWDEILAQRNNPIADAEIQELAHEINNVLHPKG